MDTVLRCTLTCCYLETRGYIYTEISWFCRLSSDYCGARYTTRSDNMTSDGVSTLIALKVYRLTTTCLSLIILTGLTIYMFYYSFKVASLSSWHAPFLTLGVSQ